MTSLNKHVVGFRMVCAMGCARIFKRSKFVVVGIAAMMAAALPTQAIHAQSRNNDVMRKGDKTTIQAKANFVKSHRIAVYYESAGDSLSHAQKQEISGRVLAQLYARIDGSEDGSLIVSCNMHTAGHVPGRAQHAHHPSAIPCRDVAGAGSSELFSEKAPYVRRLMFDNKASAESSTLVVDFSYL